MAPMNTDQMHEGGAWVWQKLNRILTVALLLAAGAVVWSATVLGLSFNAAIPASHGCELWYINSTDGWRLVVPRERTGLVRQGLGGPVDGLAVTETGFVVRLRNGETVVQGRGGDTWSRVASGNADLSGLRFRSPAELRRNWVLRRYWWVFAAEAVLLVLAIVRMPGRVFIPHG